MNKFGRRRLLLVFTGYRLGLLVVADTDSESSKFLVIEHRE